MAPNVRRPSMRFVPVKSEEQQAVLMLHRARDLLVRQRTMLVNALRGHLASIARYAHVTRNEAARAADKLPVIAVSKNE